MDYRLTPDEQKLLEEIVFETKPKVFDISRPRLGPLRRTEDNVICSDKNLIRKIPGQENTLEEIKRKIGRARSIKLEF